MRTFTIAFFSLLFLACQKEKDPCSGIVCQNDGICINGACDCPERWSGPDCSTPARPESIRINGIAVTKWPTTKPNGTGWDTNNTPPDLYIVIRDQGSGVELFRGDTYYDVAPGSVLTWAPRIDVSVKDYSILVYDEDLLVSDEFIGGYQFPAWKEELGHPRERVLFLEDVGLEVVLDLLYSF